MAVVSALAFCLLAIPPMAAAQMPGVECDCPKTGPYHTYIQEHLAYARQC